MSGDLAVIRQLLRGEPRHGEQKDRLERFYGPQAEAYDRFRERLLWGRKEMITSLPIAPGAHVVELGGGTGRNLEFIGDKISGLASFTIVDLCPSLLQRARQRSQNKGWHQVRCIEADATRFGPEQPVDVVYLSYALTMIPDWFAAIDNALAMLKPGGIIGVVDFYVSRKHPSHGHSRHSLFDRTFWPLWFGHDGVFPHPDHVPYLLARTQMVEFIESRSRVPYLPGLRCPYYRYVGRKL